ncbi:hypothetical protein [Pseudomonas aeruginosa]|uniref:hypothetical protein n=1 Tax=Pseudomonas aeruginosa TaxID=287 RepID=UPI001AAF6611|nr:hypothetical protein [Pseudomonas aeruginosa]MBO2834591.1 hypothetical protein [Pseudomonas aeruginosa]
MQLRTERDVVIGHTSRWFAHSEWNVERFAHERLAPALAAHGLIEPLDDPQGVAEYQRTRKNWAMRVGRIFNESQPFPLEWKWVWLSCLPEEYQHRARRELLAMAGCFDVRLPEFIAGAEVTATPARLGVVMQEIADFVSAAGPAHDGRYDRNEDPAEVDRMLGEGLDLLGALANELYSLSAGTGRPLPLLLLSRVAKGE